jgi:hypothetical protein
MKSTSAKTNQSSSTSLQEPVLPGFLLKRLLTLSAVVALVALSVSVTNAANILFNGDLDQIGVSYQVNPSPIGWVIDAYKNVSGVFLDGADSETFCNVQQPNGYGLFFKPFQGQITFEDLLTVNFYQDNPATPNTKFTLSGYAAGEANFCGFFSTNTPAPKVLFFIDFLDISNNVVGTNGFDLVAAGLPNGGPGSMHTFQYTTTQVTAPAKTVTVRAGVTMENAYSTTGAQSFFVDAMDLEAVSPAGSPVITNEPPQITVAPGGTAVFTVGVSNSAGVTYQWQHANTNLSDGGGFSGSTNHTLTVTNVSASDVGHYRVLVTNGSGAEYSADGTLAIQDIHIYPVISLTGKIGDTYRTDYATAVAPTNWIAISTNKLSMSPQTLIDTSYPQDKARFYRSVFLY